MPLPSYVIGPSAILPTGAAGPAPAHSVHHRGRLSYLDYRYQPDDILLFGRESAGVPDEVHEAADARLRIPIREGMRSLNVAVAAAIAVGEAVRQTGGMPG